MTVSVSMRVNGKVVSAELDARTLLVTFLRDRLRLTGTHVGCDTAQCGACTVHVNGKTIKSCSILAAQAEGADILTIEGLAHPDGTLHPMQAAFKEHHGLQCGFCTPGIIMSAVEFVARHPNPSEHEVRESLDGNLCRCTGYHNIVKTIMAGASASQVPDEKRQVDAPLIGARVLRKEDYRFLTGAGQFTDNVALEAQTYAVFVHSPHAHAKFRSVRTDQALKAPGVLAVYTGDDINAAGLGGLPCGWLITDVNGQPMKEPAHPCLAQGKVRYVGDHVAVVIAETLHQAHDAAALVEVDYEALEAVWDTARAGVAGAPVVHDIASDNTCFVWALGDKAAVDAGFARAAHVTELEFTNNRLVPNAIEPRAAVAQYSRSDESFTLYVSNQNPHVERLLLAASVLKIPEHKLRVVAPDVGGAFGSKIYLYAEEAVVTWAARQLNRPVKWTADRSESFLCDAHGRDHVTRAKLALDKDGRFLALDVKTTANMGAYLSTFAPCIPTILYATLLAGQYATPAIHCQVTAVFTNTAPVDAYRGAGRPEATYVVERLVETAAREMGIDPAEIRRRNFIRKFPHQTPVALQYDTGDYEATLNAALQAADVAGFERRRKEAAVRGKLRGIGYSAYIEACGLAPSTVAGSLGARAGLFEAAEVRVHPTGSVTVFTGSHAHGQGHETTFAQVVAERLGIGMEDVTIVHGDTAKVLFGMGTYGSRSIAVGGTAIVKALDKIVAKGRKIAAYLLEASDTDVVFERGVYKVPGRNTQKTFTEIALAAYVPHNYPHDELEPGLNENAFYDPPNFTFPAGTYVCEVEVDPETGSTRVVSFTAVDDFGQIINPMIVEGQVHGGLTQGIGQALMESCRYDESGQLVTGSLMDYCIPRATDVPFFHVDTRATPCTHNPLGVKGCGEAGAIGAPAAVMNAITDALGIKDLPMPATPQTVWRAASGRL